MTTSTPRGTPKDGLSANRPSCPACRCGRRRATQVHGEGSLRARVMLVAERPSSETVSTGTHWSGPSGRWIAAQLRRQEMSRSEVFFTTLLRCQTPNNRFPTPLELKHGLKHVMEEVRRIRPRIVCLLGSTPLRAVLGKAASLSQLRGRLIMKGRVRVVPMFHPSFVLRNPEYAKLLISDLNRSLVAAKCGGSFGRRAAARCSKESP